MPVSLELCQRSALTLVPPGGGGEGRGLPYKKRTGVPVGKFEKNPTAVPRSCFVGVT